ncbi:MAG: hypothetical protein ACE5HY_06685 [Candidatus Hydrothermarchaeales archaeon]
MRAKIKMRAKIRMKNIIDMIVFGEYRECMERYDLDQKKLKLIRQALINGRWKVA